MEGAIEDDEIRPVPLVLSFAEPVADRDLEYSGRIEVVTESGSR